MEGGHICVYICEDSPTNADVDWRSLIARRKEAIATVIRTHDSGTVHVREDGMVEPHSTNANPRCQLLALKPKSSGTACNLRIRVGFAAVLVCQASLHPGDQTIRAGHLSDLLIEVLHAVVFAHWRGSERSIANHDSLGLVLGEELGFQDCCVGVCVST